MWLVKSVFREIAPMGRKKPATMENVVVFTCTIGSKKSNYLATICLQVNSPNNFFTPIFLRRPPTLKEETFLAHYLALVFLGVLQTKIGYWRQFNLGRPFLPPNTLAIVSPFPK